MAQTPSPIPLISIGRLRDVSAKLGQSLTPQFTFSGIIDFDNYSPQTGRVLLSTLNPYPAGVIVGGGISREVQLEVENVVKEHNAAGRYNLKFVCIPMGIRDRLEPAEVHEWIKDALSKEFGGVSW